MQNNQTENKKGLKERSYHYALEIIALTNHLPKQDQAAIVIYKQLIRSATSIGANIIEAQAGSSRKDFTNFFSYALKSANESKFWLGLLKDSGKIDSGRAGGLLNETAELANILASSIITLKGRRSL
ncbi:MAG: four helix bundle protein [Candidatus Vogelbacteria bacterium]|nr:four helix bundle protein [Candidatus Vogelbacteria bacterium]